MKVGLGAIWSTSFNIKQNIGKPFSLKDCFAMFLLQYFELVDWDNSTSDSFCIVCTFRTKISQLWYLIVFCCFLFAKLCSYWYFYNVNVSLLCSYLLHSLKAIILWNCRPHYNVNMTGIQVGHEFLNLTTDIYMADKRGAIIDSGTTLAYLPQVIYEPLVKKVSHWQQFRWYPLWLPNLMQRSEAYPFMSFIIVRYSPGRWIWNCNCFTINILASIFLAGSIHCWCSLE